jgi:hypothetical protein
VKLNRLVLTSRPLGLLLLIVVLIVMLVSACGPFGIGGMSADQIKEFAKIKDANATCIRGVYAGAIVTVTTVNADKGVPSGITIKESCEVIFNTVPAPAKQP